ncbi:MAG: preprotein translocase subunit SecE [Chlamydiota bacterium]|nr:preprotein translocase subunit SecE [Chlamydiota bacterium]
METKKTQKATVTKTSAQSKKAQSFFSGVKAEFKKITWTNKAELQTYTKIVVGATFLFGMGVYFVDLSIRGCLATLEALTLLIFG